jgi:hypothetical protein
MTVLYRNKIFVLSRNKLFVHKFKKRLKKKLLISNIFCTFAPLINTSAFNATFFT